MKTNVMLQDSAVATMDTHEKLVKNLKPRVRTRRPGRCVNATPGYSKKRNYSRRL